MAITNSEWDTGEITETSEQVETTPVGEYDTEKNLIVAFLDENVGNAYTKWEIVRGVDFDQSEDPSQIRQSYDSTRQRLFGNLAEDITDIVGDIVASSMVIDDIDEALDELVAAGTVEAKEITEETETQTYYRLVTGDA